MFARLLFESFRRQVRRKAFAVLAVTLGMSITTAMVSVATDVGDKLNQELRTGSANLLITPLADSLDVKIGGVDLKPASDGAYIHESDLLKIKSVFWKNNILGYAPFLSSAKDITIGGRAIQTDLIGTYFAQPLQIGEQSFVTGVRTVNGFWKVAGNWPADNSTDALAGSTLAHRADIHIGDTLKAGSTELRVSGILTTGSQEDEAIVAPLHLVQQILNRPEAVRRVVVSALTKPEDAFARQNPATMSPAAYERWSCSSYANSIADSISKVLPNVRVEQIRQVEQNQGNVLSRISGLMLLLTIASLLASALAVSAVMAATIIERRQEVGLMKSLGAGNSMVVSLFLTEAGILAIGGGILGFTAGVILAHRIGQSVFGSVIAVPPVVLAIVLISALAITFLGSTGAIRKAMRFDPAVVLRGDA
ncbi:MAG TPA: ABC transporter permease [Candidatus Angelobacter sp.]|jgi:putative ABC transport system permease protein|nr:ABC transporter permease [Candidatus Angelobacter sp.]